MEQGLVGRLSLMVSLKAQYWTENFFIYWNLFVTDLDECADASLTAQICEE